jgi:hypothetical protein
VFSANVELFKAARLQHVSDVKEHYVNDHRSGSHSTYSIDDDAGPDAVPPGLGHYEEGGQALTWVDVVTLMAAACLSRRHAC